jgi:hypothetical protein
VPLLIQALLLDLTANLFLLRFALTFALVQADRAETTATAIDMPALNGRGSDRVSCS